MASATLSLWGRRGAVSGRRSAPGPAAPARLRPPRLTSGQAPRVWEGVTSILVMMLNTLPPWAQRKGTVGRRGELGHPSAPLAGRWGSGRTSGGFTYSSTSHTLCSDEVMPLTLVMTELSGPVSLSW